ncbi:GNAT family N-acetyltransferase [Cellulomonas carbonis]|uniref:GCN5 family acetyltransferase n=1 Tax=Cellulomonas carbonis T26 TaxID=947969 RepID=A0A0A0BN72_9CELL|nr:GNAT family N-acetyltransferase [Cellulomonas carbonis]KGM08519.1 GCN5 family acetyltransferase [Cellulomonas carbonis T26]
MVDDLPDVIIRPATVDDAEQIAAVHIASWREAYAGAVPEEYLARMDVHERATRWQSVLESSARDDIQVWVAEDEEDGHVVGFASVGPSRDEDAERTTVEIYTIYLEPAAWGRGVARRLMRTLLEHVPAGATVTLWVLSTNERAHHFYRRHGFMADGVERLSPYDHEQLREIRFVRR